MADRSTDLWKVEFRDDDATMPDTIARCIDALESMEAGRAYKLRAFEVLGLKPGSFALDAADDAHCAHGEDPA